MRWLALILMLPACAGDHYDDLASALGPEDPAVEPGPRHRPGQPCLVCHGRGHERALAFDVAGTIYEREHDAVGLGNAEIDLTDADGDLIIVTSNAAGNFAVIAEEGLGQPEQLDQGIWRVPAPLAFPLRVKVRSGGLDAPEMKSLIQREGSCAACHFAPAGQASNGPVFVID